MSRDKQIEEMARTIYNGGSYDTHYTDDSVWLAEDLYNAGYRKKSEVAREIFEEIENNYADFLYDGYRNIVVLTEKDFNELKKKYESEGEE